jgi:hypothetical protein
MTFRFNHNSLGSRLVAKKFDKIVAATFFTLWASHSAVAILIPKTLECIDVRRSNVTCNIFEVLKRESMKICNPCCYVRRNLELNIVPFPSVFKGA